LDKAEKIWNTILESDDKFEISEFKTSEAFIDFLLAIKQIKYINLSKLNKNQKLAIILNVYQTMFIHYLIKAFISDNKSQASDILSSIKYLFAKSNNVQINIVYEISGYQISLKEMKHIVIRRNKKPPENYYFNMAKSNDARVNFIDENEDNKLLIVCPDPPTELYEFVFTKFEETGLQDQIKVHCENYVAKNIIKEQQELRIPKCFKDYIKDFGNDECDLVSFLVKFYKDKTVTAPSTILKNIREKQLSINYY